MRYRNSFFVFAHAVAMQQFMAAPERLWEEDRDGDGLISRAEFSGPQGRVPRAWPLLAELERTAGAGAWLSARQMGARRVSGLSETTGSFATPPL